MVRLSHDHTGSFATALAGVNTPDTQQADNDVSVGLLVEAVSKSPFASDTLIIITEDDCQDGSSGSSNRSGQGRGFDNATYSAFPRISPRGPGATLDERELVRLAVQDVGIGLDPAAADRLFDAFYTTKNDGMGIGLSVSRSIVERHGGRLWAMPNEGPGATFAFSIPCRAEEVACSPNLMPPRPS